MLLCECHFIPSPSPSVVVCSCHSAAPLKACSAATAGAWTNWGCLCPPVPTKTVLYRAMESESWVCPTALSQEGAEEHRETPWTSTSCRKHTAVLCRSTHTVTVQQPNSHLPECSAVTSSHQPTASAAEPTLPLISISCVLS